MNLGTIAPDGDDWVARKLRDLERQIEELRGARTLEAASIGAGGLTIKDDGSLKVIDPVTGRPIFKVGSTGFLDGSGRRQMAALFYRDDGTAALHLGDWGLAPGHPKQQALQWFDRLANIVVADDTNGGWGLARPWVDGGANFCNTNLATWPATTNAAWTSIATAWYPVQNPRLQWVAQVQADAGTTGEFRVTVSDSQVGSTKAVTAAFDWLTQRQVALPAGVKFGDWVGVNIEARRTAGTGTVRAAPMMFAGDQSP